MARVKHTVEYYYGSYSGTSEVICDEDDDRSVVIGQVRRQERLNFLAMCSEGYTITNTEKLNESDY